MAARALILDYGAILRFRNTYIDEAWFDTFEGCPEGVKRIEVSGCVYMLSAAAGENSHLLVTKIKENGLCTGASRRREAFERACHVALSVFERSVVIPTQWRPYHRGAHISIFASAWKPSYDRVYFHVHPKDMQNVWGRVALNQG